MKVGHPIPWIVGFKDVTDIQRQIHRKLINELATICQLKERHLETVTSVFAQVMEEMPAEQRANILRRIGATRELIEQLEVQVESLNQAKKKTLELERRLQDAQLEIEDGKRAKEDRRTWAAEVAQLSTEKEKLLSEIAKLKTANIASITRYTQRVCK